ncbi:MAG TPA: type IV secretory system conjugative DNA transfer family protein [Solirubrobacteraceae bacterium]
MIFGPLRYVPYVMSAMLAGGLIGLSLAWWLRRRTTISIRNLYPPALAAPVLDLAAIQRDAWLVLIALLPLTSCVVAAALAGRRWRLSDLGAGDELRQFELSRRWLWQPATPRAAGERVRIATQGQIIRERGWPPSEPFVPLTADTDGPRAPRRSGHHVFTAGATGSGKTTSALRCAAGRVLKDRAALFFVDQKGDPGAETFLRRLAAVANVPFILLDPRATDSDHWQPLWGDRPAEVVARVLAGIETSEPYYADVLRQHVTLTAATLHTAGTWPPSLPLLVDAAQLAQYPRIQQLAARHQDNHPDLWRRVRNHARFVKSSEGQKALAGGLLRLDLVIGEAWRDVLTPRTAEPTGELVAVSLTNAIHEHAVVLWRTHVDQMPDEAKTVTALILNDIHASAVEAQTHGPALWTVVLDEFGAVITTAGDQALALLQRGRTHEGQVHVITQSVADIEALTGKVGLLASMADNFTAFIIHHQTAPESRDWLAKLMGTTALWQSTDQTAGHAATGAGTRRRVREFRIASDQFGLLNTGEAVIHTTLGPPPVTCNVKALQLPDQEPERIGTATASNCEMTVHPAAQLTSSRGDEEDPASSETPDHQHPPNDPSSGSPLRTHGMENL